jgi:20S proteasome alpha/beta subunit
MTLVAGFVCADGFTIAADTEETTNVRSQTSKLEGIEIKGRDGDFNLVIGMSGSDAVLVRELVDEIKASVLAIESRTVESVEDAIKDAVHGFWEHVLGPNLATNPKDPPVVSLLIGMVAEDEGFRLWQVSQNAVAIVRDRAFIGSGSDVGALTSERLFRPGLSTAAVHYIATEILKEGKTRALYVGGSCETWSVRTRAGRSFFHANVLDRHYLWGIEDAMASAVRCALDGKPRAVRKRLHHARKILAELCKQATTGVGSDVWLRTNDFARDELEKGVDMDSGTILDAY